MTNDAVLEQSFPQLSHTLTRDAMWGFQQAIDTLVPLGCLENHCQVCGETMQVLLLSHLQMNQWCLHLRLFHVHVMMNHRILMSHMVIKVGNLGTTES